MRLKDALDAYLQSDASASIADDANAVGENSSDMPKTDEQQIEAIASDNIDNATNATTGDATSATD